MRLEGILNTNSLGLGEASNGAPGIAIDGAPGHTTSNKKLLVKRIGKFLARSLGRISLQRGPKGRRIGETDTDQKGNKCGKGSDLVHYFFPPCLMLVQTKVYPRTDMLFIQLLA